MTNIGIIRKVDDLGRIVIPKELRAFYNLPEHAKVEILGTEQGILIRRPAYEVKKVCNET